MTRRERLEARIAKREAWALSRKRDAERRFEAARITADGIPLGQPILVGHHSEARHRRDIARINSNMRAGCESAAMATRHESKADGLARALDASIYSDDPDAMEALTAKLARLEAERETARKVGAWWRKAKKPSATEGAAWAGLAAAAGIDARAVLKYRHDCAAEEGFCGRGPVPSYVLSNLGGEITRCRKRIEYVKDLAERKAATDAAGGVLIERDSGGYCGAQFDDYPGRAVVDSLKAAGFYWSGGRWLGHTEKLPECVLELERKAKEWAANAGSAEAQP